jgi:GNAT superfamily N-acetyltransferase
VWALFVDPAYEGKGIGRRLHDLMLEWYFSQTRDTIWLGTAPDSRAERFYRSAGWIQKGMHGKELRFEMSFNDWSNSQKQKTF